MKNEAEEKAIAFVRELQREELTNSNHSGFYIMPQLLGVAHKSFMVGYKEAMRWRDPKIELPEYYKKVEIKIKRDDVVDYVNASLLAEDDGSLFFGDYNFVIFIKLKDVIGWRPIE